MQELYIEHFILLFCVCMGKCMHTHGGHKPTLDIFAQELFNFFFFWESILLDVELDWHLPPQCWDYISLCPSDQAFTMGARIKFWSSCLQSGHITEWAIFAAQSTEYVSTDVFKCVQRKIHSIGKASSFITTVPAIHSYFSHKYTR